MDFYVFVAVIVHLQTHTEESGFRTMIQNQISDIKIMTNNCSKCILSNCLIFSVLLGVYKLYYLYTSLHQNILTHYRITAAISEIRILLIYVLFKLLISFHFFHKIFNTYRIVFETI